MSFIAAANRSLYKLQPCGQPHLVSYRLPEIPFQSSIGRKAQRVWYMYFIAAAVGGKFFASTYFELLATFSWNHE